ncbi:MAG: DNA polymerase IV [Clostridia bacterium]|nr:DNA polymerase IV [Clostridia bacterium]
MERQILHVDVNNAFLSWTAIERLRLGEELDIRTIPAIIGGDEATRHGVVLAKSIKAKEFGIRTGEPIYQARKKCPDVQVFQGNFDNYKKHSNELYNLLLEYTDKIERFSIDECFMDLTSFLRKEEKLIDKAYEISKRVKEELGFTVNVGVANNKLLAKMASDFEKPDKVHTLFKNELQDKMWKLPAEDLFMVGKKSIGKLNQIGIKTIGDIASYDKNILIKKFGKHGRIMWEYANGIDESEVAYEQEIPKGIGNSITLPEDVYNINKLNEILLALTEQVGFRLRKYNLLASVVNVQIRTKDFTNFSHQRKLDKPTNVTKELYETAKKLLEELHENRGVRLIGIRVDKLISENEVQISLFDTNNNKKQEKLDKVMDDLKKKYGYEKITRAGEMKVKDMINIREEKGE